MKKKNFILCTAVFMMLGMSISANAGTYGDLYYEINDDRNGVTITDCNSSAFSVTIPEQIDGLPVTDIGDSAFRDCTKLEQVDIPSTVVNIHSSAFYNCTNLSDINIPDSVTQIQSFTFFGCNTLTTLTIPKNVTYLGMNLVSSDSLTTVNFNAIACEDNNSDSTIFTNCFALTTVNIGEGVTRIPAYMLKYTRIKSVTLPNSVTEIGKGAFMSSALTEISLPDGLLSIGSRAFYDCDKLTDFKIPDSVENISAEAFCNTPPYNAANSDDGVIYIDNCLIKADTTLSGTYTIKDGTRIIASEAFYKCKQLSEIIFPDSLEVINSLAFSNCSQLSSIAFPNSLETIDTQAFSNCSQLSNVAFSDSIKTIGNSAFYSCNKLTKITIPDSVEVIKNGAFSNCYGLMRVNIGDGVKEIGSEAFYECENLIKVTFGKNIETIGSSAFCRCSSLKEAILPDSLKSIGDTAFSNSRYSYETASSSVLETIVIEKNVTSIGNNAFKGAAVKNLTFNSPISIIGGNWFVDCQNIEILKLPATLTGIQQNAFSSVTNLKEIHFAGTEEQWDEVLIASGNDCLYSAKVTFGNNPFAIAQNASLINVSGKAGTYSLIFANSEKTVTVPVKLTSTLAESVSVPSGMNTEGTKVFLWDSLKGMKPLADAITIH